MLLFQRCTPSYGRGWGRRGERAKCRACPLSPSALSSADPLPPPHRLAPPSDPSDPLLTPKLKSSPPPIPPLAGRRTPSTGTQHGELRVEWLQWCVRLCLDAHTCVRARLCRCRWRSVSACILIRSCPPSRSRAQPCPRPATPPNALPASPPPPRASPVQLAPPLPPPPPRWTLSQWYSFQMKSSPNRVHTYEEVCSGSARHAQGDPGVGGGQHALCCAVLR